MQHRPRRAGRHARARGEMRRSVPSTDGQGAAGAAGKRRAMGGLQQAQGQALPLTTSWMVECSMPTARQYSVICTSTSACSKRRRGLLGPRPPSPAVLPPQSACSREGPGRPPCRPPRAPVASASGDRLTWAHISGMPGVKLQTCRSCTSSTPATCRRERRRRRAQRTGVSGSVPMAASLPASAAVLCQACDAPC